MRFLLFIVSEQYLFYGGEDRHGVGDFPYASDEAIWIMDVMRSVGKMGIVGSVIPSLFQVAASILPVEAVTLKLDTSV